VNAVRTIRGLGGILLFLLLWEAIVRSGFAVYEYLPAPSAIAASVPVLLNDRGAIGETVHTVGATLLGWSIAIAIGISLGALLGFSKTARDYGLATVELLRPIPAVALVPVAMLLFGFSIQTELLVIVIPSIWPVLVSTMRGIMTVPARLEDVARTLRLGRLEAVAKVLIPAAASAVLVGCRLSMTSALVLAIVSEMIGNPQGIGYAVVREAQALHPDLMFAYVLITGILGVLLNAALLWLSRLILPGEFKRPPAVETAR
jgi:ABC-type nitrate/sulfonate/bicarbonate transport system permease component